MSVQRLLSTFRKRGHVNRAKITFQLLLPIRRQLGPEARSFGELAHVWAVPTATRSLQAGLPAQALVNRVPGRSNYVRIICFNTDTCISNSHHT